MTQLLNIIDELVAIPESIRHALKGLDGLGIRPMFGEQALFCEEIMFLWIVQGRSYLRESPELARLAQSHEWLPLTRMRSDGHYICFRYYALDDLMALKAADPLLLILDSIRNARLERELMFCSRKGKVLKAAERRLKLPEKIKL